MLYVVDPHRSWYRGGCCCKQALMGLHAVGLCHALVQSFSMPLLACSATVSFAALISLQAAMMGTSSTSGACTRPAPATSARGGGRGSWRSSFFVCNTTHLPFSQTWISLSPTVRPGRHVVFIGDSMGATAALLFAHLASEVHAWTPQVDLASSSIRWVQVEPHLCGFRDGQAELAASFILGVAGKLCDSSLGPACCQP